ncbi:EamA family transporter [Microbacterium gorillae]|uniref:EamA family transporter n=1 Tax=Microbacterium gorillae TaxID=1231063 RepID=UPI00058B56AA|nr:DMT family transporter [Microbacterium gorillae]
MTLPDGPSTAVSRRPALRLGLVLALLTALCFGTSGALARGLIDAGWTPGAAVTARVWVAALVLLVPAVVALRGRWHLVRANILTLLLYGAFAVGATQLFYFQAVALVDVGVALLIEYMSPVAVVLWLWLRHGDRPRALTIGGGLIAIAGLVLVLDVFTGLSLNPIGVLWAMGATVGSAVYFVLSAPEGEVGLPPITPAGVGGLVLVLDVFTGLSLNPIGVLWAMGATVGSAVYFVLSAQQGEQALPPITLAGFGLLVGAIGLTLACVLGVLPFAVTTGEVAFLTGTVPWWVPVVAIGVIAGALAYVFGIVSTRMLGSRLAAFVALSEVLAAVLFGWLLLGQLPGLWQLLGGVLILVGVVLVRLGEPDEPGPAVPEVV